VLVGIIFVYDELVLGQFPLNWCDFIAGVVMPRTAVLEHLDAVLIEEEYFVALLPSCRVLLALSLGNEVMHVVSAPLYLVSFKATKVNGLCFFTRGFIIDPGDVVLEHEKFAFDKSDEGIL